MNDGPEDDEEEDGEPREPVPPMPVALPITGTTWGTLK
jgi:hypothetical protein